MKSLGSRFVDEECVPSEEYDKSKASNSRYLNSKLIFEDDKVVDSDGNAVMMGWETPLMVIFALR